jgi:hypothetical protein
MTSGTVYMKIGKSVEGILRLSLRNYKGRNFGITGGSSF